MANETIETSPQSAAGSTGNTAGTGNTAAAGTDAGAPAIIIAPAPPTRPDFVHLHVHTDFSLLDGCALIDNLLGTAVKLGQRAIAITDHGNLFGLFDFWSHAKALKKKKGVDLKPLLGCEIYLVYDFDNTVKSREIESGRRYHMGLLAKDFRGYQNLVKLVSDAHVNGLFAGKQRVDMKHLAAHAEGLIGFSGCMQGVIPQALLAGDDARARKALAAFLDIFGKENFFIEIQNHGIPQQVELIPKLLQLAADNDLQVVCTNDVHYVRADDYSAHDAMVCITTGKKLDDKERMRYAVRQFYLRSGEEMARIFDERPDALRNTNLVAEMCDVSLPTNENNYPVYVYGDGSENTAGTATIAIEKAPPKITDPKLDVILDAYVTLKNGLLEKQRKPDDTAPFVPFDIPEDKRVKMRINGTYLLRLCKDGLRARYGVNYDDPAAWLDTTVPAGVGKASPKELCERVDLELSIIAGTGFIDYFLIVWDFINWAREHGIPVGPGRGSGAGSLVAYCLRITDIDPIRFNLLFERFLNPERVSAPDFDVDFCMNRRDEVVEYVKQKYGRDRVSNIITYGTFGAKVVVRDLARVRDVPFAEATRLAKLVPSDLDASLHDTTLTWEEKPDEPPAERKERLKKFQAKTARWAEFIMERDRNPTLKEICTDGLVIEGMTRNTGKHACGMIIADRPLTDIVPVTLQDGDLTTQYSKKPVEELGLLKMDFLGLKTLTIIDEAVRFVRRKSGFEKFDIEAVPLDDAGTFALLNAGHTVAVFQLESGGMQGLCRKFAISTIDEIIALIALYRPGPMQFIDAYVKGKFDPESIHYIHPLLKDVSADTYGILVYQEQVMSAARVIAGYTLGGADQLRRAMGKKDPKEMARHRDIFVAGAAKTNNIDAKTANEIFDVLEKFAEYGFNKSHSAAYAFLSYRTAYLKAHHPVEFMAANLNCELGNASRVALLVDECANMGINLRGPDINESQLGFDPDAAGNAIRYGLAAVKGVGEKAAEAIIAERKKNGRYLNFLDLFERHPGNSLNNRAIENLIKSGAFDFTTEDRNHLLASIESAKKAASSAADDRASGQGSLFDLMDDPCIKKATDPILRDKPKTTPMERLQFERELLGFYLSGHPMNAYAGLERALNTFSGPVEELRFEKFDERGKSLRTPVRLCGVVSGVQKKMTKGDAAKGTPPRPFCFFSLGTKADTYSISVFPEAFEELGDARYKTTGSDKEREEPMLAEGHQVAVEAECSYREDRGEWSIAAHRIDSLEERLPALLKRVLFVLEPTEQSVDFIEKLAARLHDAGSRGNTEIQVGFAQPDGRILQASFPSIFNTRCTAALYYELVRHPACLGAAIEPAPLVARTRRFPARG